MKHIIYNLGEIEIMDIYTIKKYNNNYIIFLNYYKSPIEILPNLEKDLKQINHIDKNIYIDALLYYGNNNQRYSELLVSNGEIVEFKFLRIEKNSTLRKYSTEYFNSNQHLLKNSIIDTYSYNLINKLIAI